MHGGAAGGRRHAPWPGLRFFAEPSSGVGAARAREASGTPFSSCVPPVSLSLKCFSSHRSFVHTFIQQTFIEAPPHPRWPLSSPDAPCARAPSSPPCSSRLAVSCCLWASVDRPLRLSLRVSGSSSSSLVPVSGALSFSAPHSLSRISQWIRSLVTCPLRVRFALAGLLCGSLSAGLSRFSAAADQ